MQESLPPNIIEFRSKYPAVWDAFAALGQKCHETGPLDEKTRRLVKLALAVALRHEGAVHSAVRNALRSGISREEMHHVVLLAITTLGWPAAYAAMTWIEDELGRPEAEAADE